MRALVLHQCPVRQQGIEMLKGDECDHCGTVAGAPPQHPTGTATTRREPCPFCGCPGEQFDGHVCEDFAASLSDPCRVYWGSHGCRFEHGHEGDCECHCCECVDHAANPYVADGVLCVAKPPYYGPETRFYGEHAAERGLRLV